MSNDQRVAAGMIVGLAVVTAAAPVGVMLSAYAVALGVSCVGIVKGFQ